MSAAGVTAAITAAMLATAGCGALGAAPSRKDWLARELEKREAQALAREPRAVSEKLARMGRNRFDFFRGTSGLEPGAPTRFVTVAAGRVAVLGDPHPENIGTYPTGEGQGIVDFNDFDLAAHGPYLNDLRRLALGLWVVGDLADLGKKQRGRLVEAACEGYLDEIARLARGEPATPLQAERAFGGDLTVILAESDGLEGTPLSAGIPQQASELEALRLALLDYRTTLVDADAVPAAALTIKRAVAAQAGVSSFPVRRYRLQLEGPTAAADDDWLVELKAHGGPRDAEAVVRQQRAMQARPDLDPFLGWATVTRPARQQFRVRRLHPEQRRLSVERLAKLVKGPGWGKKDLRALARDAGALLGAAHGRAPTADGKPGAGVIAEAAADRRGLIYETLQVTARAADTLDTDWQHLRTLLRERGPLLGWR